MMKRAETVAMVAVVGLIVVGGVLMAGAIYGYYGLGAGNVAFWAGSMAALGQAVIAGLAWWGIRLARQQAELGEGPGVGGQGSGLGAGGFKMSYGDDTAVVRPMGLDSGGDVKTLETGFQRVVVLLAGVVQLVLAGVILWMVKWGFAAFAADPSKGFPVPAGDPLTVVVGVGAAAGYLALLVTGRTEKKLTGQGEAVSGLLTLGLPAMVAVAVAGILTWVKVAYAAETAAGVWAFVLAVQGFELVVNSTRSYAGIEEFDQTPVDLQATPLTPMLTSVWMGGLKLLAGQALGLGGGERGERGVIARMVPRALVSLVVLAVLVSMIRVVPAGEVAVLERFGVAQGFTDATKVDVDTLRASLLQPGLHITLPWPIDELVYIPEKRIRMVTVGVEVALSGPKGMQFHFWTFGQRPESDTLGQFVTGDFDLETKRVSPQLLESFAGVWWRVKDPALFYKAMSHSDFFAQATGGTRALPIYEAMVQQVAERAMTQSYAMHSGEQIMTTNRREVEAHTQKLMQDQLNALNSGIEVVQFNIKDVHPPMGNSVDPSGRQAMGPAMAFEAVVRRRQEMETLISEADAERYRTISTAQADRTTALNQAHGYQAMRLGTAKGEADEITAQVRAFTDSPRVAQSRLLYDRAAAVLPNVPKVILGPGVKPPVVLQEGTGGNVVRPMGN